MNGQENVPTATRKKLRLLVVDDEPNVCECLKLILALDGHHVVTANSGKAGLELFQPNQFDVVCTDYSMPGMRGDQFAAAIKSICPEQPILLITGLANTMHRPESVDLLMGKPFVPNDLRRAFEFLMDGSEEERCCGSHSNRSVSETSVGAVRG